MRTAASRKLGQFRAVAVAQIWMSCPAPKTSERPSKARRACQGCRTTMSKPNSEVAAAHHRVRDLANAHPSPKPRKHSSSARFLT
jgi:hypothetical protein